MTSPGGSAGEINFYTNAPAMAQEVQRAFTSVEGSVQSFSDIVARAGGIDAFTNKVRTELAALTRSTQSELDKQEQLYRQAGQAAGAGGKLATPGGRTFSATGANEINTQAQQIEQFAKLIGQQFGPEAARVVQTEAANSLRAVETYYQGLERGLRQLSEAANINPQQLVGRTDIGKKIDAAEQRLASLDSAATSAAGGGGGKQPPRPPAPAAAPAGDPSQQTPAQLKAALQAKSAATDPTQPIDQAAASLAAGLSAASAGAKKLEITLEQATQLVDRGLASRVGKTAEAPFKIPGFGPAGSSDIFSIQRPPPDPETKVAPEPFVSPVSRTAAQQLERQTDTSLQVSQRQDAIYSDYLNHQNAHYNEQKQIYAQYLEGQNTFDAARKAGAASQNAIYNEYLEGQKTFDAGQRAAAANQKQIYDSYMSVQNDFNKRQKVDATEEVRQRGELLATQLRTPRVDDPTRMQARQIGAGNNFEMLDGTLVRLNTNGAELARTQVAQLQAERRRTTFDEAEAKKPTGFFSGLASGFTSRGFNGGGGGFGAQKDDILANIGGTAGTLLKYTALSVAIGAVSKAISEEATQVLDYTDSLTDLKVAFGDTDKISQSFISSLSEVSRLSGSNVAEAMDTAARGARAFRTGLSDSKEDLQDVGLEVSKVAAQLALITNKPLTDATGDIVAIGSAYGLEAENLQQINDAIAGAKDLGGDPSNISQGLANIAVSAKEAGFTLAEAADTVSLVVARTDESGQAAATRLSRIFAIFAGQAGQSTLRGLGIDTNNSIRTQVGDLAAKYETLGKAQQAQVRAALGGTANVRELIPLLTEFNRVTENSADAAKRSGRGQEEFNRKAADLTGILKKVQGDLKNIEIGVFNTGILTAFGVALVGVENILHAVAIALETIDKLVGVIPHGTFIAGLALDGLIALTIIRRIQAAIAATRAAAAVTGATGLASSVVPVGRYGPAVPTGATRAATTGAAASAAAAAQAAAYPAGSAAGSAAAAGAAGAATRAPLVRPTIAQSVAANPRTPTPSIIPLPDKQLSKDAVAAERKAAQELAAARRATIQAQAIGTRTISQQYASTAFAVRNAGTGVAGAVTGAGTSIASGLRRAGGFLTSGLGLLAIAIAGAVVIDQLATKGSGVLKAAGKTQAELDQNQRINGTDDPASIRQQAADLRTSADALKQASGGLFGTITNAAYGDPAGKGADAARQAADRLDATAKRIDQIRQDAARGRGRPGIDNPEDSFNLNDAEGIANGLKLLDDSGRNAITQFDALDKAIQKLGRGAADKAGNLSDTDSTLLGISLGQNVLAGIQGGAQQALDNRSALSTAVDAAIPDILSKGPVNPLRFINDKAGAGRNKKQEQDASRLEDFQKNKQDELQKAIEDANKELQDRGESPLTPEGRKDLEKLVRGRVDALLPKLNDPTLRQELLDNAVAAVGTSVDPFAKATDPGATVSQILKNAKEPSQKAADLTGTLVAQGKGTAEQNVDGADLAAAKTYADNLRKIKSDALALAFRTNTGITPEEAENYNAEIDAADQAVTEKTLAHLQALEKIDEANLSPFDEQGKIRTQLDSLNKQLETAKDPEARAQIESSIKQGLDQQAQQQVTAAASNRSAGIDPRDQVGASLAAAANAQDQLDLVTNSLKDAGVQDFTTSDAYNKAVKDVNDTTVAALSARRDEAAALAKALVDPRDENAQLTADIKRLQGVIDDSLPGSAERAQAIQDQAAARRAQALGERQRKDAGAALGVQQGDGLGNDQQAIREAETALSDTLRYDSNGNETEAYLKAVKALNDARATYAKDQRDASVAQAAALVRPGDDVAAAAQQVKEAESALVGLTAGNKDFYDAQKALADAQRALADAQLKRTQLLRRAGIDRTDSLAVALDDLTAAREKLASDAAQGQGTDVLTQDGIDVKDAENRAESEAFNRRLSDAQTADKLGRTSHAAYLAYLDNEHDRLSAISNRTRQQQDELDQIDGLIKDAKSSMNGQFNIGDIKLPTLYQVRNTIAERAAGLTAQAQPGSYVAPQSLGARLTGQSAATSSATTNNQTVNIQINGGDVNQIKQVLANYLGAQSFGTATYSTQKI